VKRSATHDLGGQCLAHEPVPHRFEARLAIRITCLWRAEDGAHGVVALLYGPEAGFPGGIDAQGAMGWELDSGGPMGYWV